jgi:hypothetical protein
MVAAMLDAWDDDDIAMLHALGRHGSSGRIDDFSVRVRVALTWAATQGATTRELMARPGHASPAAALRYHHATADRDASVAAALSGLAEAARDATRAAQSLRPRDIRGTEGSVADTANEAHRR